MPKKRVVVLGAGISGLTTAALLLQQEREFEVTVVAKHFPGELSTEFTSPWAGAHWRSYAENDEIRQQEFEKETFQHFWGLAKAPGNKAGVMIVDGFDYWDELPKNFSEPWFSKFCPEYRHLRKEELPTGVEFGTTYKTVCVNAPTYLNYLLNAFTSLGGTTKRANLSHLNECIESDTDIVINCSGIHAKTLGGVEDKDVYAARGQIAIVQLPPSHVNWTFERYGAGGDGGIGGGGAISYVIPRDNGEVILGGTYNIDDYSTQADPEVENAFIERCLATRPDLLPQGQVELTIKKSVAALRPCRKGGIRIETEWTTSEKFQRKVLICHNYGHGGYGYQSSYGASRYAIKTMKEALNPQSRF